MLLNLFLQVVSTLALNAPQLLSCEHDRDWASFGATLDSHLHITEGLGEPPANARRLPSVCAREDRALFNWSDHMAGESWPSGDAFETFSFMQHRCHPEDSSARKADVDEACRSRTDVTPCLYGVVSASACIALMYLRNVASMYECCTHSALGAAKGLKWLLRSGDKALEFLDSSTWPVTVEHVATLVGIYQPMIAASSLPQAPVLAAMLQGASPEDAAFIESWSPGTHMWLETERAAHASLALIASWSWPPRPTGQGEHALRQDEDSSTSRGTFRRRVHIYAFGTHCSVMAEPVSAMALLFSTEFELHVIWRGAKEYCGYHSGNWPVVTRDEASPVREVYDAFHERDLGPKHQRRSHRDSLRDPRGFEQALRAALAREGTVFSGAHLAFCSEPALACLTMHDLGKPVLGYFGVHPAFMVKDQEEQLALYRRFRDNIAMDQRSTLATVAPYISLQILHHVPLEVPAVRPLSLYTLPAVYTAARRQEVLLNKRPIAFWDVAALLDKFAQLSGKDLDFVDATELFSLGRYSFQDWAAARAAVYFPYDWLQTLAFYDWVNMGLPTFVPDLALYTFSRGTNADDEWQVTTWSAPTSLYPYHYSDWEDLPGRLYWWRLTDFHALPGVRRFASVSELFEGLASQDALWRISGELRQAQLVRTASAAPFWRSVLLRALASWP